MEICGFCKQREIDESSPMEVFMNKEIDRIHTGDSVEFKFEQATANVPRCKNCAQIHNRLTFYFQRYPMKLAKILAHVLGIALGFGALAVLDTQDIAGLGALIIGWIAGYYIVEFAAEKFFTVLAFSGISKVKIWDVLTRKDQKKFYDIISQSPEVRKKMDDGWGIGAKPFYIP